MPNNTSNGVIGQHVPPNVDVRKDGSFAVLNVADLRTLVANGHVAVPCLVTPGWCGKEEVKVTEAAKLEQQFRRALGLSPDRSVIVKPLT